VAVPFAAPGVRSLPWPAHVHAGLLFAPARVLPSVPFDSRLFWCGPLAENLLLAARLVAAGTLQ
jgi:hypothetical protein